MVLLALTIPDEQQAAETVLHLWYSARIRPVDMQHIENLRPMIQMVCTKIADRRAGSLQGKTFTIGLSSIRVILKKEVWAALLESLHVPVGLSIEQAHAIRVAVAKAPQREDHLHRSHMFQKPEHRVCKDKFRTDGILVPFGCSRKEFTVPNP